MKSILNKIRYWFISLSHGDIRFPFFVMSFGLKSSIRKHKLMEPCCKIVKGKHGYLYLTDLHGNTLPHQISLELYEGVNQIPYAKVKLHVDISELK